MLVFFSGIVALTNLFGSVSVDTFGARVVSYVPAGGRETLANLSPGYGGIPLCWPWFRFDGPKGMDSPKHGIARNREFEIVEHDDGDTSSRLVLRFRSDPATHREWPYDFTLTLTVSLSCEGLSLELAGENTGTEPFPVTEAFHPYFLRSEVGRLKDKGSGTFRTWDPDPESHLKTVGIGPNDWKKFICIENGTFAKDAAYILHPGERHVLSRTLRFE